MNEFDPARAIGRGLSRRSLLTGTLGGIAALALAGCADRSGAPAGGASGGGDGVRQLVVAVPALAPTLDGVVGGGGINLESFEMNANLQAGLVRNPYIPGLTPDTVVQDFNTYVGYLAESYEVSDDGLTYTFVLRDGLMSPLGNTITADDVLYSFERKWNVPTYSRSVWESGFAGPEAITRVDDRTVAFELLSAGFGLTFLGLLANLQGHVYDSTALQEHATPDDPYALEWARVNGGWGLGPYHVTSQVPDQEMILTANEHYALGEPAISQVTLRVVGDAGTRASLVVAGDVEMAQAIRPADQARLAGNDDVVVPEADPIEYVDLTLVTNKAPFDDPAVRRAMAHAVPYDQIAAEIYNGRAVPMIGNINPNTLNYTTDGLPRYGYDPARARELLAEAGFPDGVSFTVAVSTANPDLVDTCVLLRSYAADAGFTIDVAQMAAADFGTARTEATNQALIYRNRSQVQTPTYACTIFWRPDDDPSNPSRWDEPASREFWEVVDRAQALPDPLSPEAGELWHRAQTILLESTPEIFVCGIQPSQVFRSTVHGFAYRSENAIDYGHLEVQA